MNSELPTSSVKERLATFLFARKIKQSQFCRSIGVSAGYISSMRSSISSDKVLAIRQAYPELNTEWLLYGIGEMLLPEEAAQKPDMADNERQLYKSMLAAKDAQIESLQQQLLEAVRKLDEVSQRQA